MNSIVYFTKDLSPNGLVKILDNLNFTFKGTTGVKLHSGEAGNQNFIPPEFIIPLIKKIPHPVIVESNTAYEGERNTTSKHIALMKKHGWSKYFEVDILDEEDDDIVLDIPSGRTIKKNYVGNHLKRYQSMLVLSHFKGHPMGGYGGALKQLSIGVASSRGKAYIHSAGRTIDVNNLWNDLPSQDDFLSAMSDSSSSVHNYFKGNICYISILKNISVDCDCCSEAEDPCMKDIGIMASLDPIAIDIASLDMVYAQKDDKGLPHFKERVESRHGKLTIDFAESLGFGTKNYTLINIDE